MKKDFENGFDYVIIPLWNEYVTEIGYGEKIWLNDAEFFNKKFSTPYDAAWSVYIGDWRRADIYVSFNDEGILVSFNRWNDENSPIDVVRLSTWLQQKIKSKNKKGYVDNIPRAIHDALQKDGML